MNRIRALREDMDLRQIDVAEMVKIDQKTLSNYETEKTLPDSYALIKLADFFNVSIDYLVGRTNRNYFTNKNINNQIDCIISDLQDLKKSL